MKRIYQTGRGNDCGAVLIVVKDRDVHQFAQSLLDYKAVGSLDVFEIYPAKCRTEIANAVDEGVDVLRVHFEIDRVHVSKALEQYGFAFHHGFRSQRAEIAQAQDRCAVRDHGYKVAAGCVVINCGWIFRDCTNWHCDARGIGEAQVPLCGHRLGGLNFNLARLGQGVKEKCFLVSKRSFLRHVSTSVLKGRPRAFSPDLPGCSEVE